MPRSVSINNIQVLHVQLAKDASGNVHVYAQYNLRSGSQVVQPAYQELTARLGAARKAAALAVLDGLAQDIAAIESV